MKYLNEKHPEIETLHITLGLSYPMVLEEIQGVSSDMLKKMVDACPFLSGLGLYCAFEVELDEVVGSLVKTYPKLQEVMIRQRFDVFQNSSLSDQGLSSLLQLKHLQVLYL